MGDEEQKKPRGFTGLDDLTSRVDLPSPPSAVRPAAPKPQDQGGNRSSRSSSGSSPPSGNVPPQPPRDGMHPGLKWGLVAAVVAGIYIFNSSDKSTGTPADSQPQYTAAAPEVQQPVARAGPIPGAAPRSVAPSALEDPPPYGSGLTLSENQIRYCVSQDIRMTAWNASVDQYSQDSVAAFNAAVAEYNARCSNFKYRAGSLERIRAEVEARRGEISSQGTALAARKPKPEPFRESVVKWSPNGKAWPASANYLKGMPKKAMGGLSKLTIDNTSGGSDVYVKLCRPSSERCDGLRHVFIPLGAQFTFTSVAPGTYDIRYRALDNGAVAKSDPIELKEIKEEDGTRFSVAQLSLYRVANGNANFTPLTDDNF